MLLGDLLINKGLITAVILEEALREQKSSGDFLGAILVKRGRIREEDLLKVLSEQFGIPLVNFKIEPIDWNITMRFSSALVLDYHCLPFREDDSGITVAIQNPLDALAVSRAEKEAKNVRVKLVLASAKDMRIAEDAYRHRLGQKIRKLLE